jgi:hypothetical protein
LWTTSLTLQASGSHPDNPLMDALTLFGLFSVTAMLA